MELEVRKIELYNIHDTVELGNNDNGYTENSLFEPKKSFSTSVFTGITMSRL